MKIFAVAFLLLITSSAFSQGTQILTGGDYVDVAIKHFVKAAGGENAKLAFVPTAASVLKLPRDNNVANTEAFARIIYSTWTL